MGRKLFACILVCLILLPPPTFALGVNAYDTNRFAGGVQRLLMAPFQIPIQMLNGTVRGPLLFGTLGGVFTGLFRTVGDLAGGTFDMVAAAAPYAKYALFAL